MTRQARAQPLTMRARRKLVYRRMGVLALALAVPAMAAPSLQQAPVAIPHERQAQAPYEAEQTPALAEAFDPADETLVPTLASLVPSDSTTNPGPAARPFFAALGYADRGRAEQCLAMAVYYEAASESIAGQRAVAQVVMNRVRHPSYPSSVCGVVFQGSERATGCQFSFTCDGSLNRQPQAAAMARARMVARAALGGYVFADVGLATHYHRTDIYPYWASSLQSVGTIGLHHFYRWTGAAGRPGAFTASYAGGEAMPQRRAVVSLAADPVTERSYTAVQPVALDHLPPAPVAVAPATPSAASTLRPQSGAVLEQHARSGQWLNDPR